TYLPLFPMAIERLDLSDYDLIISSSHCVAKGIVPRSDALHLCYCFTPMRYVWDMYPHYFGKGEKGFIRKLLIPPIVNYLRMWDVSSSARVDFFIAISHNVKRRIWNYYRREAEVIYPPVDAGFFLEGGKEEGYFLLVSALAPYKRIDLAIQAANQMGFRLLVIGIGPEEKYLKKIERILRPLPRFYFPGRRRFWHYSPGSDGLRETGNCLRAGRGAGNHHPLKRILCGASPHGDFFLRAQCRFLTGGLTAL
ncbi:MAG: hypothetical protein NTY64_13765, partial [Deltaproteobacteria bacterium]|nr:hypothetical protein [Deltaproteobacteria bacterium]